MALSFETTMEIMLKMAESSSAAEQTQFPHGLRADLAKEIVEIKRGLRRIKALIEEQENPEAGGW